MAQTFSLRLPAARQGWLAILLMMMAGIAFSIFYLCNNYSWLAHWFLSLNPAIPYAKTWQTQFFTLPAKHTGNMLCAAAIPVFLLTGIYSFRQWRIKKTATVLIISRLDVVLLGLLTVLSGVLGYWGHRLSDYGADEMYSAYYCASLHPFQTMAYYMDPNNHVLFNLLNNIFSFGLEDKILTGRIISILAYTCMNALLYLFLKKLTGKEIIAFVITLAMATQFQVWGFAVLARGYELYLLCHWLAVISFFRYQTSRNETSLMLYALASAAGFWVMPSFLYLFVTLTLAGILFQIDHRKEDLIFWKYTLLTCVLSGAVYLPAFAFSGISAVTSNKFVAPGAPLTWPVFFDEVTTTMRECLWLSYPQRNPWEGLIYLIPLLLFCLKRDPVIRKILATYLLVWPVYIAMAVAMNRFANMRNLIFQQQFTLLMILLTGYCFGEKAVRMMTCSQRRMNVIRVVPALIMILYFIRFYKANVDFALYGVSTHHHNQEIIHRVQQLPKGTTMAMPNWAISWYYLAKGEGYAATTTPTGTEQVLVMHYLDKPGAIPNYTLVKEYTFYYLFVKDDPDSAIIKPLMQ